MCSDAAGRAGLKEIPAWVREMTDETAFMQFELRWFQNHRAVAPP